MIVIRPARAPQDLQIVRALMREYQHFLEQKLGEAHGCYTSLEKELDALPSPYEAPPAALLVAFYEYKPAGCVALRVLSEDTLEMKRLWVKPEARGLGIGLRLVEESLAHAGRSGVVRMVLDTVPAAMPEALALYRSLGFREIPPYAKHPPGSVCLQLLIGRN